MTFSGNVFTGSQSGTFVYSDTPKKQTATYRIQVRRGDSGSWYWRIVARNGQIVATSETYANKANAKRAAIRFHREAYEYAGVWELKVDK